MKKQNLLSWVVDGRQHTKTLLSLLAEQGIFLRGWIDDEKTAILEKQGRLFTVWDNGGEIGVERINTSYLRMIPYVSNGVAVTLETLAYRLLAAVRGEEVDWNLTIDTKRCSRMHLNI